MELMIWGPINRFGGLSGTHMSETCWVTLYILFIKIIDNLQLSEINNMHAYTASDPRSSLKEQWSESVF